MFVKNNRKSTPYPDGPLLSSRWCDSIVKKPKQPKHKRTVVSKPMVAGKQSSKHKHIYQVTEASLKKQKKDSDGLIDGGANGGLTGKVMQPMEGTETPRPDSRYVNVNGIFNHQTPNKPIVKACTVLTDSAGQNVLGVFNE